MEALIQLGITLAVLVFAYFVGSMIERRHFESLRGREARHREFPTVTFETLPEGWQVAASGLAVGSTVVSLDYFKRFLAGLRGIIGGRIKSYEPLLDRARREALLRMTEQAVADGYDAIFNVRLETSRLASSRGDGKGTSGVEMLAFGTAVKLVR
jgi:uncharacterized protein YbjQ (UPF0145 family)